MCIECAPNVILDWLEEKQYEIYTNDETMYLNPIKQVYGVHDETVEDGIMLLQNLKKQ